MCEEMINQEKMRNAKSWQNCRKQVIGFVNEEFRQYPFNENYFVSNLGRVYSKFRDILITQSLSKYGYLRCYLGGKTVSVHRIVAFTFLNDTSNPFYGKEVNHINFCRTDNRVTNLEWCDGKYNMQYSYNAGRFVYGQNSRFAKHTNEQAIQVCKLLQDGKNIDEILDIMNLPKNHESRSFVWYIYNRQTWNFISKDYDFSNSGIRKVTHYDNSYKHLLCKMVADGLTARQISEKMDIECDHQLRQQVSDIKHKRTYKNIFALYNN